MCGKYPNIRQPNYISKNDSENNDRNSIELILPYRNLLACFSPSLTSEASSHMVCGIPPHVIVFELEPVPKILLRRSNDLEPKLAVQSLASDRGLEVRVYALLVKEAAAPGHDGVADAAALALGQDAHVLHVGAHPALHVSLDLLPAVVIERRRPGLPLAALDPEVAVHDGVGRLAGLGGRSEGRRRRGGLDRDVCVGEEEHGEADDPAAGQLGLDDPEAVVFPNVVF